MTFLCSFYPVPLKAYYTGLDRELTVALLLELILWSDNSWMMYHACAGSCSLSFGWGAELLHPNPTPSSQACSLSIQFMLRWFYTRILKEPSTSFTKG